VSTTQTQIPPGFADVNISMIIRAVMHITNEILQRLRTRASGDCPIGGFVRDGLLGGTAPERTLKRETDIDP
jgi:hypothetical protein